MFAADQKPRHVVTLGIGDTHVSGTDRLLAHLTSFAGFGHPFTVDAVAIVLIAEPDMLCKTLRWS